jgi:hypothetical protein
MNDAEMMDVINHIADDAERHRHDSRCDSRQYATGNPPHDYWGKAARFARSIGFTLIHGWEPRDEIGEGCDGYTTAYIPPCPGCGGLHGKPQTIIIAPDLNPAQEFAVVSHELAHAYLNHPPKNADVLGARRFLSMITGTSGRDPRQETSAHLASMAACAANGLYPHYSSTCYVKQASSHVEGSERHAAFLAGRAIAEALA